MKRRDMLLATAGVVVELARPASLRSSGPDAPAKLGSFRALTAGTPLKIGAQATKPFLQTPDFAQFVTDNFDLLTPGLEFRWFRLRPTPDTFTFADADWMIDFCRGRKMAVHGHNLCWNAPGANPSWLPATMAREQARKYLVDHISAVVGRYCGRIESWDVVNEPVVFWSKRPDGLYPGAWLGSLGEEYFDIAFNATRAADPHALRVLNCYYVEQDSPECIKTRELTLALLQRLLKRGVPVQAVGLESHLSAALPQGGAAFVQFLKQIKDMGLQLLITELDVDDSQVAGDTYTRDKVVGQYYYDFLVEAVQPVQMQRVILWSPSDRANWLNGMKQPKFIRGDGQPHRPGLLDDSLRKKSVYDSVAAALMKVSAA